MKTFLNILGGIVATFLSLILVCVLLVLPTFQGAVGLLQPRAVESVIDRMDLEEVLLISPDLTKAASAKKPPTPCWNVTRWRNCCRAWPEMH